MTVTFYAGRFHFTRYSLRGSWLECDYGTVQRQWLLYRALRSPRASYRRTGASTLSTRWLFPSAVVFAIQTETTRTDKNQLKKTPKRLLAEKYGLLKFSNQKRIRIHRVISHTGYERSKYNNANKYHTQTRYGGAMIRR